MCKNINIKVDVQIFNSSITLKSYIDKGNYFDILFLDIEMNIINGLEVGKWIRNIKEDENLIIIYISGIESYAMQLFETRPFGFLIKPILYEEVELILNKVLKILNRKRRVFTYKKDHTTKRVELKDILFFESNAKKVKIHFKGREDEFYGKLSDVKKYLEDNIEFIQIHNSYLVNYTYVISLTYENFQMSNGLILPISQKNRKQVSRRILQIRKAEIT